MANPEPNILVPMTLEEAARRWLSQQGMFAIAYSTVEELATVYRAHGPKVLVYETGEQTYFLCEKHEREAMLKEAAAKRAKV